jgi:queuine tRNA-ribosyltransferase
VAGEMTAATLNSVHNLHFYLDTMRMIGKAIESGTFGTFMRTFLETYSRRQPV